VRQSNVLPVILGCLIANCAAIRIPVAAQLQSAGQPQSAAQSSAATRAAEYIDSASPRAWAFNEAVIRGPDGFSGEARLVGTGSDGGSHLLFETSVGYSPSIAVTYYAWPGLVAIEFQGTSGNGVEVSASMRLPLDRFGFQARQGTEVARLSTLAFPFRQTPWGTPLESIGSFDLFAEQSRERSIAASDGVAAAQAAASFALARLFFKSRQPVCLVLLGAWTALVIASAFWRRGNSGDTVRTGIIAAAVMVTVLATVTVSVWLCGTGSAELYSITIPENGQDGRLYRMIEQHDGYVLVRYTGSVATGQPVSQPVPQPGLGFIAIRSPVSSTVPVSALRVYDTIRFQNIPLVTTGKGGRAVLKSGPLILAWGIHE